MSTVRVARVIPPNECVIYCKGWSIAFVCDQALGEDITWEQFHGNAFDDRMSPIPPNLEPLKPLKELTRSDRWQAKKIAFGILKGSRERARKQNAKAKAKAQRAYEEPLLL